ncbi:hypothetical protein Pint_05681 [Pistacia integerrima]|uniref:Uncharacterized protein n=1 Tax=Pistacia integerrima TaxID=434235 RepID=A0ACC0Z442_9ROSI|nr:hypothetical protein Pint_05681 [Pistacia integerrima]
MCRYKRFRHPEKNKYKNPIEFVRLEIENLKDIENLLKFTLINGIGEAWIWEIFKFRVCLKLQGR